MAIQQKSNKWSVLPNYVIVFILLGVGLCITSCNQQAKGFALPEGDIGKGKVVYQKMSCNECHRISEIAWKGGIDSLNILLGGKIATEKTYGELVSSVINPSHKIARYYKQETMTEDGRSKMRNYNEVMTVQELVDLVAFLQSEYKVEAPPMDYYPYHY